MFKIFDNLTHAINNEIAIDREVLMRVEDVQLSFIPLRPLKTSKYLSKLPFNKFIYFSLNILSIVIFPLVFFYLLLFYIKNKLIHNNSKPIPPSSSIILVANNRTIKLLDNLPQTATSYTFKINFNQINHQNYDANIIQYIGISKLIKCYFLSILYLVINIPKVFTMNVLQLYVTYEWLVKSYALRSIPLEAKQKIYFSNHYDRWAVMFDSILEDNQLHLIQHGVFPDNLVLPYKLKNICHFYTINLKSQEQLKSLYQIKNNVKFETLSTSISLTDTDYKKDLLIIGQPQSIQQEIEIIKALTESKEIELIWIKPHPLYSDKSYKKLSSNKIKVIEDKSFFPKVAVALNYNSTLGIEYKSLGIPVIEIKNKSLTNIELEINEIMLLL